MQDFYLWNVAKAALAYREEEQSDTPRLWRGKKLQDLANKLDEALEELFSSDIPPQPDSVVKQPDNQDGKGD